MTEQARAQRKAATAIVILSNTQVTDAGVNGLTNALPNVNIAH